MDKVLIALLLLLASPVRAADYIQPPGAPEVFVANHGVTVSVFAVQTAVGHGIGVMEKRAAGWYLCNSCLIGVEYPSLDSVVNAAGGAGPWVAGKLADINAVLSIRYPAVMAEATGTTLDKVNLSLNTYRLGLVNGTPQLGK